MRLRSSAGITFSHTGFGTMPNIAPPSSLNVPSLTAWSSKSPSLCIALAARLRGSPFGPEFAPPQLRREEAASRQEHLADGEDPERERHAVREAVGMEPDAELIDAEPRPADHDVPDDRQDGDAPLADHAAPPGVEQERVPQHDQQRAVLLRVPAPEAAPRIVRPEPAEHR